MGEYQYLFILSSGEFNHGFGRGVVAIDFSEDSVTVVGHDNSAHWVHKHLKHGPWPEGGSNNITNGLLLFLENFWVGITLAA
jgi:hypothetical protein